MWLILQQTRSGRVEFAWHAKVITGCCPIVAPKRSLKVNPAFFLRDAGFSAISILLLGNNEIQWDAVEVLEFVKQKTDASQGVQLLHCSQVKVEHFSTDYKSCISTSVSWGCCGGHFLSSIYLKLPHCLDFQHSMPLWLQRAKHGSAATTMILRPKQSTIKFVLLYIALYCTNLLHMPEFHSRKPGELTWWRFRDLEKWRNSIVVG